MRTHRIDLSPVAGDKARMKYVGKNLEGISGQPLFAAARSLLAEGLAEPDDRIETWRDNTKCLSGPVWAAAKLTVKGTKFARYESTEQIRMRFAQIAIDR